MAGKKTLSDLLTVGEASELIGISRQRIHELIDAGRLQAEKYDRLPPEAASKMSESARAKISFYVIPRAAALAFKKTIRQPGRPKKQPKS
jgi:hypothetical protein